MAAARILIVEDERITAEDLRDILQGQGYEVTAIVSTGTGAIDEAGSNPPDLVIMDIRIQGEMDGVEAARIIRERYDIPAVYLTAHADAATLDRAKRAEPLGYIVKPFQESELHAAIEMALHKQRVDRSARDRREQLTATFDAMGEGVITIDAEYLVTLMNPAAEAWTGFRQQEALGRSLEEILKLDEYRPVQAALEGALTGIDELTLTTHDGTRRSIAGSASPVRNAEGTVTGAVIVFGSPRKEAAGVETVTSGEPASSFEFVVESAAMHQVLNFSRRVAASEVSAILVQGESGTGKDLLAKYIHYNSRRGDEPFLAINCAAIPETLLESELFGYEKGAFTDARQLKKGILELAHGGTVFLDEIGEMPLSLQAKLLRVLEDQTFRRLGGLKDVQVNLRVITATNRDLREAIQGGRFRLDLYYRLNVIQIAIPPLRERREDVIPLANHFLRVFCHRFRRDLKGFAPATLDLLLAHDWPGNVREVRNAIERALVLEETQLVHPASVRIQRGTPESQMSLAGGVPPVALSGMSLEDAERTMLLQALERTGWNQSRAARLLSITRDTLRYKMKKFNLREDAGRTSSTSGSETTA